MIKELLKRLSLREVHDLNLDEAAAMACHRDIIESKPFLKKLYRDFYSEFLEQAKILQPLPGRILELGSGGGFLHKLLPEILTSDVCAGPDIEQIIFADRLSFKEGEIKGIFMMNVLHHLSKAADFFSEAVRVLPKGGRLVMIEPYNSLLGRLFYKNFHAEPFEETAPTWEIPPQGRMTTSNQALPWIIFKRDRHLFETRFPALRIRRLRPHTVTRYIISGGLSFKTFVPAFSYPLFRVIDECLAPFSTLFPMFVTIVLEKI